MNRQSEAVFASMAGWPRCTTCYRLFAPHGQDFSVTNLRHEEIAVVLCDYVCSTDCAEKAYRARSDRPQKLTHVVRRHQNIERAEVMPGTVQSRAYLYPKIVIHR